MNDTLSVLVQLLNQSGGIPLKVTQTSQTIPVQFWITIGVGVLGSVFVLFFFWNPIKMQLSNYIIKSRLRRLVRKTGRHVLIIKHTESSMFNMSMITTNTVLKIISALNKFKGEPFDLVLHSPGGEIFYSLFISRLLHNYRSKIRCLVPVYAMSGGSLLALSCGELFMSRNSCIGPIDPQLGMFWDVGSSRSWEEIVRKKGSKSNDSSIGFAFMGRQYTKAIRSHIDMLISGKLDTVKRKEHMLDVLTDGTLEHAHPLTVTDVVGLGYPVKVMPDDIRKFLEKIMYNKIFEGIYFL